MNSERSKSPLQFFADLGDLIARYATRSEFAIGMVIVSWIVWPIGVLIASLLIASLYLRGQQAVAGGAGSPPPQIRTDQPTPKPEKEGREEALLGLALIGLGLYLLAKDYFKIEQEILLPIVLVAGGVLVIWYAYAHKGGASHA